MHANTSALPEIRKSNEASHTHFIATEPVGGRRVEIGTGFSASNFDHRLFGGLMDPLVMVDHFTMSEPTFGTHPHAGISAVSVMLEDSRGRYHNRDSLGNDVDLEPGDLYWLKAGRGAVHNEGPRPGARAHGLQIFVNLPASGKHDAPESLHVRASDIPEIRGEGHRVRVVLGDSQGVSGHTSPASPLTILDAHLERGGSFRHTVDANAHAFILAIRGRGRIVTDDATATLPAGHAIAARSTMGTSALTLHSEQGAQFVILEGEPLDEPIAQRGGFVMNTPEELVTAAAAHAAGDFGHID